MLNLQNMFSVKLNIIIYKKRLFYKKKTKIIYFLVYFALVLNFVLNP